MQYIIFIFLYGYNLSVYFYAVAFLNVKTEVGNLSVDAYATFGNKFIASAPSRNAALCKVFVNSHSIAFKCLLNYTI